MRRIIRGSLSLFPLVALAGILAGGWAAYAGVFLVAGMCLGVDVLLRSSGIELFGEEPEPASASELSLRLYLLAQIGVVLFVVWWVPRQGLGLFEWIGSVLSVALVTGTLGTLVAHEYIHRGGRGERLLGTLAFGVVNYAHFRLSHVIGHHSRVGFHDDWSTARRGESSYAFLARAVIRGWQGAWAIEARRLRRRGDSPLSLSNEMLVVTAVQVALWLGIGLLLGPAHLAVFLAVSVVSVSITELVNYLGHYGLVRHADEPIAAEHSWESDHKLTNWLLLEAGKHCDHHLRPARPHTALRLQEPKRRVPYGVPVLLMLALVPPLFFGVMHRFLDD